LYLRQEKENKSTSIHINFSSFSSVMLFIFILKGNPFIHWKVQLLKRNDKKSKETKRIRDFSSSLHLLLMLMMMLMILPYFCTVHNCRINKTILNIFLIEILNALIVSFIVSQIRASPHSWCLFHLLFYAIFLLLIFLWRRKTFLCYRFFQSQYFFLSRFIFSLDFSYPFYLYFYRATRDGYIHGTECESRRGRKGISFSLIQQMLVYMLLLWI